jgi:hypothetical protein
MREPKPTGQPCSRRARATLVDIEMRLHNIKMQKHYLVKEGHSQMDH